MIPPSASWWQAVSPYLEDALDMSDEERGPWLDALRARDPVVAGHVETLLQEHRILESEQFLEGQPAAPGDSPAAGVALGAYTLDRPLGQGGMGTVWLAERHDGEIQQKVAIKFLGTHRSPRGWGARFIQERQLLAALNHPAIVHAIDAGRTRSGQPYLVMEYVDGNPIDIYAAQLPVRERLQLFILVCEGVSHAHQRLIIHRDLKPSNILVDASGQPKLLDFGIAKLLDETGDRTQTIERVLTPRYASPEQVRGDPQSTATDVYSLAAVLYQLVTGRPPQEARAGAAAPELPAPSGLNAEVPADLDYVVRKALRDEPEARYASVEAFADDITAVLESRPVEARSGDSWYRARKFIRRNSLPLSAAALTGVGLAVGAYIANRERLTAERRFQQVRQLAGRFIALDGEIRNLAGSTEARNRIVSESLRYLEGLGLEARGNAELALEIGDAYLKIARVQGVPSAVGNLGRLAEAEESLRKADGFVNSVLKGDPHNRGALLASAEIANDWMAVLDYADRRGEALAHAGRAASQLDAFLRLGNAKPEQIDTATHIYANLGTSHQNSNRFAEAIRFCQRGVDISRDVEQAQMRRASAFGVLSVSLRRLGDLERALAAVRESRTLLEAIAARGETSGRMNFIIALYREGLILGSDDGVSLQRSAEALGAFERAKAMAESLADADPNDYRSRHLMAIIGAEIGDILRHQDPNLALTVYDQCLAKLRQVGTNPRAQRDHIWLLAGSSYPARWLHHEGDARSRLDTAFSILHDTKQYPADVAEPFDEVFVVLRGLADHEAETGKPDKAVTLYQELLARVMAWKPELSNDLRDASAVSRTWSALAGALRRVGREDQAAAFDARRKELWERWDQAHPGQKATGARLDPLQCRVLAPVSDL